MNQGSVWNYETNLKTPKGEKTFTSEVKAGQQVNENGKSCTEMIYNSKSSVEVNKKEYYTLDNEKVQAAKKAVDAASGRAFRLTGRLSGRGRIVLVTVQLLLEPLPSLALTVIVAVPFLIAVTRPFSVTVATVSSEELHVTDLSAALSG